MNWTRSLGLTLTLALGAVPASAKELDVMGQGSITIPPMPRDGGSGGVDLNSLKMAAQRTARRQAIGTAVDKVLGPGASRDPRVAAKLDAVDAQVPDDAIIDTKANRVGDVYEVRLRIVLDDKEFRTLLSDLGIAINTAAVRASSILAVMDEFITNPREVKAPLEELTEFSSERGDRFRDKSKASASSDVKEAASLTAPKINASASNSSKAKVDVVNDVEAESHDVQRYRKLIKYQPQGGTPEEVSQSYNALMGQLQDYDLRVLDNDVFRSRHFKDSPLTIAAMQGSEALSRYVAFAKSEANADFFMVGNSIIIDSGKNPNTGDFECTGVVTLKTYSTVDGESIASETFSEASVGRNINECAGLVSKKIARIGGPIVGARIQEYWKRRQTYGTEKIITLLGANLPLMTKTAFTRAVRATPGIEADAQRVSSAKKLQLTVTYKGTDPLDQALAMQLSSNAAFATLDARSEGNQVIFCLGPCVDVEKQVKE